MLNRIRHFTHRTHHRASGDASGAASGDVSVLDAGAVYTPEGTLDHMWFHLEDGEGARCFKAVCLNVLTYLPREVRETTTLLEKMRKVLKGLFTAQVDAIYLVANVTGGSGDAAQAPPQGIVQLYGVQAVAAERDEASAAAVAADTARRGLGALRAAMANFEQARLEPVGLALAEWIRRAFGQMPLALTVVGQPDPRTGVEGVRGMAPGSEGGSSRAPVGLQQNEYLFRGMAAEGHAFLNVVQVFRVATEDLYLLQERVAQEASLWASKERFTRSISVGLGLPVMLSGSIGDGASSGYGVGHSQGVGESVGRSLSRAHTEGQSEGEAWGTSHTESESWGTASTSGSSWGHVTGRSETVGTADGVSHVDSQTQGTADTHGTAHTSGSGSASGGSWGSSTSLSHGATHTQGETIGASVGIPGTGLNAHRSESVTESFGLTQTSSSGGFSSSSSFSSNTTSDAHTDSHSVGASDGANHTASRSVTTSESFSQGGFSSHTSSHVRPVPAAHLIPDANRVAYRRGTDLTEWYINDERGLEQGFTLSAPPRLGRGNTSEHESLVVELAITGDLTPTLTQAGDTAGGAVEFITPGGVRVLRYGGLCVTDDTGRELPARLELDESRITDHVLRIVVDDSEAVYPLTVDPLLTTPGWTAESDMDFAYFGWSVGTAGDVNGDGYDDVIVGAPLHDWGYGEEGRIYVYHGSVSGLGISPAWTVESDQAYAHLGQSVGTAGDVNGDGYADVIVGAPGYPHTYIGRVYVYHGSASGLSTTPAWVVQNDHASYTFGQSVGTAGDVNGDGYDDVIVGTPDYDNGQTDEGRTCVYHGSVSGLSATPAWAVESDQAGAYFGDSVSTAGDVDGDGYADVIVGAPEYDDGQTDEGQVFVYHGSASGLSGTADWTAQSNQASAHLGKSVSTAGDVNGDGYDDGQTDEGQVFVYHGSASGLSGTADWTAQSDQANASFGYSVSTAGDVNGDGYADVIVGAPDYDDGQTDEGQVFVYHGSASGLSGTADWTAESDQANASFGYSVSTAGDVNGDGYFDVIVGAPYYDNSQLNEGRAYVYHGWASGLIAPSAWTAESNQAGARFGESVSTAGDVNGDGYSDVIVGAPRYDNGQADEGRTYVYHGSASGLSTTANWTAESDQADAWFGYSVSTAGDVNGDGYADVVVGAPYYDNGQTDEGQAHIYHGSASGLSATAAWTAESDQAEAYFGRSVGTAGDVNDDGYTDVVVGAPGYDAGQTDEGWAFAYHGSVSGLGTTPAWTAESDQAGARFGQSTSTAGDVNGDGYDDVIVGAYCYDNGQMCEGRAYAYHGSASGLSTSPAWTAEGGQIQAWFGLSVSTAGDVNGDGYADVIVGAPFYVDGQMDEGRAYVYHGSTSGLSGTADWTAESDQAGALFGWSVGTAGDVNGDGYADVAIGAPDYEHEYVLGGRTYVYYGSADGLSTMLAWTAEGGQTPAHLGQSVSTAGDVNGDGYADVIVGAPRYANGQSDEGRAYIYYGWASGLSATADQMVESDQTNAKFGWSVSTAGDVNGDGYADVVVGAPSYDNGQTGEGRAYVYHGSVSGLGTTPAWVAESDQSYAEFGYSVSTAGDVDGDGYADVIVGAPLYGNGQMEEGRAYIYSGSASGLNATADWTAESDQASAHFGNSVSAAGDVNGDGYADVIVGTPGYSNGHTDEGRVYVYHGSDSGLNTTADWTAESDQAGANFGWSVSTAGDVNGDGYADVIVGASEYDDGQADEGRAYVYHGTASGLSTSPAWTAESNQADASFGRSVSTAGDVNGDGYTDVVVGAPWYDDGQADEGRVYVYRGTASGLSTSPAWMAEGEQANARFGSSASTAGDVNGDGYTDVIVGAPLYFRGQTNEGRAYIYHGSAGGLNTTPDWTAESNQADAFFGNSVSTAGDVNGDGYADVVVGAHGYTNDQPYEGGAFLYYGNGSDSLNLLPRQLRLSSVPIALGGLSDSSTAMQIGLIGRMPMGREQVKMVWQVAPLGTPFTSTTGVIDGTSADWIDTGTDGVAITETVTSLTPGTPYHWRARLLYVPGNALGQPASRWVHIPWNGWNETDFRISDILITGLVAVNDSPTLVEQFTTLTATVDTGTNVVYTWAFGDGETGSGAVVTHTYPAVGIYTAVVTASNSASVLVTTTSVTIGDGATETTITYTYDPLGRLIETNYQSTSVTAGFTNEQYEYAYDAVGNRTAMTVTNAAQQSTTTNYTYDAADRLTSVDGVSYTYDDNGNLLSDGARTFTYDAANRLTQVAGTLTTQYTYAGDGTRLAQTVDGVTTRYVSDVGGSLAHVLEERKEGGNTTRYLYSAGVSALEADEAWTYHHADALGSVRQLTDEAGHVHQARGYAPFGAARYVDGDGGGSFGFAGEQHDPTSGLIYLRARYYDPATGRFLTPDTFPALAFAPQTLHRYTYCADDPVNRTDPSGQFFWDRWREWGQRQTRKVNRWWQRAERRTDETYNAWREDPKREWRKLDTAVRDYVGRKVAAAGESITRYATRKQAETRNYERQMYNAAQRGDLGGYAEATINGLFELTPIPDVGRAVADRGLGAKIGASVAVGFTPGLGDATDVYTALTGRDPVMGEQVKGWERWLAVGAAVLPGVTYGMVAIIKGSKHADEVIEGARHIGKVIEGSGHLDETTELVQGVAQHQSKARRVMAAAADAGTHLDEVASSADELLAGVDEVLAGGDELVAGGASANRHLNNTREALENTTDATHHGRPAVKAGSNTANEIYPLARYDLEFARQQKNHLRQQRWQTLKELEFTHQGKQFRIPENARMQSINDIPPWPSSRSARERIWLGTKDASGIFVDGIGLEFRGGYEDVGKMAGSDLRLGVTKAPHHMMIQYTSPAANALPDKVLGGMTGEEALCFFGGIMNPTGLEEMIDYTAKMNGEINFILHEGVSHTEFTLRELKHIITDPSDLGLLSTTTFIVDWYY